MKTYLIFLAVLLLLGAGCSPQTSIQAETAPVQAPGPDNTKTSTETITTQAGTSSPTTSFLEVKKEVKANVSDKATKPETKTEIKAETKTTQTTGITALTPAVKNFSMTAKSWTFEPASITVNKGDVVKLTIQSADVLHGFALPEFGINEFLSPEKIINVQFTADKTGTFSFFCSVSCGSGHSNMRGTLIVR